MDQFVSAQFPSLQALFESAIPKMAYEISEAQFNTNLVNDPWIQTFVAELTLFFDLPKARFYVQ